MMDNNPNCLTEDGPDFDHGARMILTTVGSGPELRQALLAGHKDGSVFALDQDAEGRLL